MSKDEGGEDNTDNGPTSSPAAAPTAVPSSDGPTSSPAAAPTAVPSSAPSERPDRWQQADHVATPMLAGSGKGGSDVTRPYKGMGKWHKGKDKGWGKGKRAGPDRSFQGNYPSAEFTITNMQLNLGAHFIHELENSISS